MLASHFHMQSDLTTRIAPIEKKDGGVSSNPSPNPNANPINPARPQLSRIVATYNFWFRPSSAGLTLPDIRKLPMQEQPNGPHSPCPYSGPAPGNTLRRTRYSSSLISAHTIQEPPNNPAYFSSNNSQLVLKAYYRPQFKHIWLIFPIPL